MPYMAMALGREPEILKLYALLPSASVCVVTAILLPECAISANFAVPFPPDIGAFYEARIVNAIGAAIAGRLSDSLPNGATAPTSPGRLNRDPAQWQIRLRNGSYACCYRDGRLALGLRHSLSPRANPRASRMAKYLLPFRPFGRPAGPRPGPCSPRENSLLFRVGNCPKTRTIPGLTRVAVQRGSPKLRRIPVNSLVNRD